MDLPIRIYGDPVLREVSRPVEGITDEIRKLADDMIHAMRDGDGIGLAAPQVGRLVRLIVLEGDVFGDGETPRVFLNPEITHSSRARTTYEEGCLSIPGIRADVERPEEIVVRYRTLDGEEREEEAVDLPARVLQHEIDHLNGKLFIDHLGAARRNLLRKKLRELQRQASRPSNA